jgi:hypothetical protein
VLVGAAVQPCPSPAATHPTFCVIGGRGLRRGWRDSVNVSAAAEGPWRTEATAATAVLFRVRA